DLGLANLIINVIHNHSGKDALALAQKLIAIHHPFEIDYGKRFGVGGTAPLPSTGDVAPTHQTCACCNRPVSNKEAAYCQTRSKRFAGRTLCRKCQGFAPGDGAMQVGRYSSAAPKPVPTQCDECGKSVSARVEQFCQSQAERFAGCVLCMACQKKV